MCLQWVPMMEASGWWWSLRQQPQAHQVLRDLLHQMLSALAVLQQANITHRSATSATMPADYTALMTQSHKLGCMTQAQHC